MVEITCPFCDESCLVEPADFTAAAFTFRCAGCSVESDVVDGGREALALAA